ncbi:hypothetical protein BSKO_13814 [Bryopsis sp. KO-2023]|nr:hypothetical protein BSKO_13814 [Bryopsis sp. KO-2023]
MAEVRRCSNLLKKFPYHDKEPKREQETEIEKETAVVEEQKQQRSWQVVPRQPSPNFVAQAVFKGSLKEVSLSDYGGRWLVLLFSPLGETIEKDQLSAFSEAIDSFNDMGAEVLAASCDTLKAQLYLTALTKEAGGVDHIAFPLIADPQGDLAKTYGVLGDAYDGCKRPLRSMFIIDPNGIVKSTSIDDEGRGWRAEQWVFDSLRKLQELAFDVKNDPRSRGASEAPRDVDLRSIRDQSDRASLAEDVCVELKTPPQVQAVEESVNEPVNANQMVVVVRGPSFQEVHFKVKKTTKFKQIMRAFCEEMDLDINSVRFSFEGERLLTESTPQQVHMESGDRLECYKVR